MGEGGRKGELPQRIAFHKEGRSVLGGNGRGVFSSSYRRRWSRSVLAFERELIAVAAVQQAEVAAVLSPSDEARAALAAAEAALAAARRAYEVSAEADEEAWAGEQRSFVAEADRSAGVMNAAVGVAPGVL
jgi:hypothetical protein